ncbi:AAA family ATPase [Streptomyces sp. NPDC054757]
MRLHTLRIAAFGPFAARQEVDFDSLSEAGLFLLHGPTGAGKTSVLDAVCYALYGAVPGARQSPGATLRSDHAAVGEATEVSLELSVGERRLEVTRLPAQPRPKKRGDGFVTEKAQSRLREYDRRSGGWRSLSKSHQEIGEEITQLIGMSREQFCQVVLLPQGDFARFLRADAEARGKLLGRLFDTRRFAAVEERLAALRRAAETQVLAGDERLLTLAHRMAEAAGPAADDWPLPGDRPGEPGLAEAVIGWAAVARAGARERLDIAGAALSAAESRQAAARTALENQRELARLQERFEQTRRRADELAHRRGERDEVRARLDRARRAERISDALAQRDEAVRHHREAVTARERDRRELPAELADAGADQLSALERGLRQDLGALDAARRAERRSAEITAERADLDRQAHADDELIREAADWLAGWDTVLRRCQDRIEAAQEAATRTEQLAGQLDPARRRLAAARERDRLARDAAAAEARLSETRERANAAHESWLDLRERRLRGVAAELAAGLREGEPCAVCGAADHPAPARPGAGHVDRAAEEAAYEKHTRADKERAAAERALGAVREAVAEARAGAGDATTAELAELVGWLERDHTEAHGTATGMHAAREERDRAEHEHAERTAAQQQAERRAAARTSRREVLEQQQSVLEEELVRARGGSASVAEHAALLERRMGFLERAAETVRAVDTTAERLKEADGRLADAAFRAGFGTPQEAAAELTDAAGQRGLQQRLDVWQAEEAALAERLAEQDAADAAARPPADPAGALAEFGTAERAYLEASSVRDAALKRCTALQRLSGQAADELTGLGPLRAAYDRVARLATLAAGTSADNERKMRLESYVLAARLEQVAAAATVRLQTMSAGRYTLVHSDARTGGRGRSGLGLHVLDSWTGRERDTATLSGGETFFASLALALGLADVVTDEAGGTRLDTLFIDEGFGSLDEQTLDDVLDVLDSLRERDRSVGIVSHVGDLRRRIPAQLEIVKEQSGSAVRHHSAGAAR